MLKLNDIEYKLISIDTNFIREIINNNYCTGYNILKRYFTASEKFILCFSIYNLIELRKLDEVFIKFVDFFSQIPSIMFFPHPLIIQNENNCYKTRNALDISLFSNAFFPLGKNDSYNFRIFIDKIFNNLKSDIDVFISDLQDIALSWDNQRLIHEKLLDNQFYKIRESNTIKKFLKQYNIKLINSYDFAKFPSVRMMEYSQFHRVHMSKKTIRPNDVMDVVISSYIPYVDVVITEKIQADIYTNAKTFIRELENLEINFISNYFLCKQNENKQCIKKDNSKCYLKDQK